MHIGRAEAGKIVRVRVRIGHDEKIAIAERRSVRLMTMNGLSRIRHVDSYGRILRIPQAEHERIRIRLEVVRFGDGGGSGGGWISRRQLQRIGHEIGEAAFSRRNLVLLIPLGFGVAAEYASVRGLDDR